MSKIISYSLFKGAQDFTELFYVRGFYFNVLMNSLVYPDWKTVVFVDNYMVEKYQYLFTYLISERSVSVYPVIVDATHCQKMLWRTLPVFWPDSSYVICRDADALTNDREAKAVQEWLKSGLILHGINDNPAHSIPLLGGMCGFKAEPIRNLFGSWENMLSKSLHPIDKHGSDQRFLNSVVLNAFPDRLGMHISGHIPGSFQGEKEGSKTWILERAKKATDLCTAFIGAAGCNEMETLRFFRNQLPNWGSDQELWEQYPKLFYWA